MTIFLLVLISQSYKRYAPGCMLPILAAASLLWFFAVLLNSWCTFPFLVQVLSSLQPLDYMVVSFLPGISEVYITESFTSHFHFHFHSPFVFLVFQNDIMLHSYFVWVAQELLFRGALLPLFGVNWKSVFVVAAIFGVLHLGGGRKYSFAIWYPSSWSGNLCGNKNRSEIPWIVWLI